MRTYVMSQAYYDALLQARRGDSKGLTPEKYVAQCVMQTGITDIGKIELTPTPKINIS